MRESFLEEITPITSFLTLKTKWEIGKKKNILEEGTMWSRAWAVGNRGN